MSSVMVYGQPEKLPVSESHSRLPLGSYGIVKSAIEDFVKFYSHNSDYQYLILRPSNSYGPGQSLTKSQGVIPNIFNAILNCKDLIFGVVEMRLETIFSLRI